MKYIAATNKSIWEEKRQAETLTLKVLVTTIDALGHFVTG